MKKKYTLFYLCIALLLAQHGFSQLVSAYNFNQYQGTYSAISGGTVFGTTANNDEFFTNPANTAGGATVTGPGLPLGFNFVYNNITYDCFGINTNGWISLGQTALSPNSVDMNTNSAFNAISATSTATANLQCRIAALGVNLFAGPGGELRAETIGSAPNRTLVVQWTHYTRFYDIMNDFNFQIRLCESTNQVQIVYGTFYMIRTTAVAAQVGLRGQANTNFNNRVVATGGSWAVSTSGNANNQTCSFNTTTAPAKGQVYEWAPVAACAALPFASAAAASATTACLGTSITLSTDRQYSYSSGLTFQWQSSPTGVPGSYVNITGGPGSGTTAAISLSPAANTFYQALVTCTNGAFAMVSTTTNPVQVMIGQVPNTTALTNNSLVCYGSGASISLSPANSGIGAQWQSSQVSGGPYTTIPNAALLTLAATNITATTYYQAVVSCTASPASTVLSTPVTVSVIPTITNTVPYLETFEGISDNYQLPNCQWFSSPSNVINPPSTAFFTYTNQGGTFNRLNHTPGGTKFASLVYYVDNSALFSNGIFLNAGVNYRGSVWYITDGLPQWFDFSLGISNVQAVNSITNIASVSFPSNTTYKYLSGTFSVSASGIYYLNVSALGDQYNAFISFDDLAIDVPCDQNPPVGFSVNAPAALCAGSNTVINAVPGAGVFAATSYSWNTGAASNSIAASAGMAYTVTATNTLGCQTERTFFINTNPLPNISVFASPAAICPGNPVSLVALGAINSYTWNNGSNAAVINVSPLVNTTYTLSGTDINGCSGSTTKLVTVNAPPVISASASKTLVCLGETVSMQGAGGNSYMWNSPTTLLSGQSVSISPREDMAFTLIGEDVNGCKGSTTIQLKVSACTGIEESDLAFSTLSVYPNPNNGKFAVVLQNGSLNKVEVTDVTGRVLISQNANGNKADVSIHELANGIYYVKVQTDNSTEVIKIVKE